MHEFEAVDEDALERLRGAPGFYLRGAFTRHPVAFVRAKEGPAAGKYAIDFLTEGPVMQWLLARINVVDGAPRLLRGYVSYQAENKDPVTGKVEPASAR